MKPSRLAKVIAFAIKKQRPILIKGAPGTGKSDIVAQACEEVGARLIISHPVVSDPTDYKGLPFPTKHKDEHGEYDIAKFIPFGELYELIVADKPTVFFLDDLGQAPMSVQAACMQLLLARRINGHKVSDYVTFLAATNRRQDKAGVMGILEPVKSRFAAIIELEVEVEDWVSWAISANMPHELVSFIRWKGDKALFDFHPTADITNTPCPRTVAYVGHLMNDGLDKDLYFEMFSGAAGQGFAAEFIAYMNVYSKLPTFDDILRDPENAPLVSGPDMLYAICGMISNKVTSHNFDKVMKYCLRLPKEFQILLLKDSSRRSKAIMNSPAFTEWAINNSKVML